MPILGKTKKDVLLEFRSTEILEAARAVFGQKGYRNATVEDIAEAAGVAKGTVYLYFPSKQDLFVEMMRNGITELHAQVCREIDAARNTPDRVRAFMGARLRYCAENRDFFRTYYTEFASMQVHAANAVPEFQDLYDQQARLLEAVFRKGVKSGELRSINPAKSAQLVYEVTRAAIAKHVLQWSEEPIESTIELLFDFVWKGIGCRSESLS